MLAGMEVQVGMEVCTVAVVGAAVPVLTVLIVVLGEMGLMALL
jgi:hypothetical protein